jgi:hypothetical protein
MNSALAWFARNHVAANLLMFLLLLGGYFGLTNVRQEMIPEIRLDMMSISVVYPGATPEEVEEALCVRIEEALQGVPGIKRLRSTAAEGVGIVTVELMSGEDVNARINDVRARIDAIDTFPDDAEEPRISESVMRRSLLSVAVSGQTYPRKADYTILSALGGLAISAMRFANDVRLLSGLREMAEPFEKEQIGSSAMAYKQNPMRSERMTALGRHLLTLVPEAAATASTQWLERTLDDSAGRRIYIPEAFLAADAILRLVVNVASGLHVNEAVARARLMKELPFMATEEVLMLCVKAGGDRQALHERIRVHSLAAKELVLAGAERNDLIDRIRADDAFAAVRAELDTMLAPDRFTGLATRQTERFLADHVDTALAPYVDGLGEEVDIRI